MRYLLWLVLCLALGLFGVALADDMDDDDGVVREEHAAPPAEKQEKQQPSEKAPKPVAPGHVHDPGTPQQVSDENQMGYYFGLGDEFIWGGSAGWEGDAALPGSRMIPPGAPASKPPAKEDVQAAAKHTAEQQADAVGFDPESHSLLRRGPNYDYFYQ